MLGKVKDVRDYIPRFVRDNVINIKLFREIQEKMDNEKKYTCNHNSKLITTAYIDIQKIVKTINSNKKGIIHNTNKNIEDYLVEESNIKSFKLYNADTIDCFIDVTHNFPTFLETKKMNKYLNVNSWIRNA